jgi:hypothetical protein
MRTTLLAIIAITAILGGCSSDNGVSNSNSGTLQVMMTDAPIDLAQVWVTITEVDVHQTGADWRMISTASKSQDLLKLKNTQELLATASLTDGSYTGFRLQVSEGHVVDAQGNTCDLKIPSDKIEVPVAFTIKAGKLTSVVLDFNAEKSVHVTSAGQSEKCILRPVITPSSVENGQ